VPAIVISPYARTDTIVHDQSDQTSITKFVEDIFGLPRLASLPDEKPFLPQGPRDWNDALGNLGGAFDQQRLAGQRAAVSAREAIIPDAVVWKVPSPWGCSSIGMTPATPPPGVSDKPPPDFSARP
jgi:hypothetical protein